MNENEFWELIDKTRKQSKGDTDLQARLLIDTLSQKTFEEIFEYEWIFYKLYTESYKSDVWAMAYMINGGCSDDSFDYFRAWLIAQGKKYFELFMKEPEIVVDESEQDLEYGECEYMIGVSRDAYTKKITYSGITDALFKGIPVTELILYLDWDCDYYEVFDEIFKQIKFPKINLDWDDDNLGQKFPKFYKKYYQDDSF